LTADRRCHNAVVCVVEGYAVLTCTFFDVVLNSHLISPFRRKLLQMCGS